VGGESVAKGLRAATGDGPTDGLGCGSEDEAEGGAERLIERKEGVRGEAGEKSAGGIGAKVAPGESVGGEDCVEAEAGEQEWVLREVEYGAEDVGGQVRPAGDERVHESPPGGAVFAEGYLSCSDAALEGDGGAVVEWVGERGGGVDPFEAVVGEGQRIEEGRARGHRVDCGAEVVVEAGKGEVKRAGCSADGGFGFEELDVEAGLREHNGGGKTVGACADHTGFAAAMVDCLRHGLRLRTGCGSAILLQG